MIEGEDDGVLPPELNAQLLARIPKYAGRVETHLLLVELRPGVWEYVLRDYLVYERRYAGAPLSTITLDQAPEIARELRKSRRPPRRRRGRT